jgi:hypothetical protein
MHVAHQVEVAILQSVHDTSWFVAQPDSERFLWLP